MSKPNVAELLRASGHTEFTADLVTQAVNTLYGYIGAGLDERDWDAILNSNEPLTVAEAALVTMYSDEGFLLRNANHLSASYSSAQIEYTYRYIAEQQGFTHSSNWASGTSYESAAKLDDSALRAKAQRDFDQRQNDGGGDGAIQITAANANVSTNTDVNATASTTNGDDTIETQFTFLTGTTIDGGGGTDTLDVTDGGVFDLDNIINVEVLDLTGTNNASTVTQMGNDFERVDLSDQGDTITATGLQGLDINGGAGADTVIYTAFTDLFNTGFRPSVIKALLNGGGGTDTIRVDDAINSGTGLNFNRAVGFERLVQNDTDAADITILFEQDLQEIDISASTANSSVDFSDATSGITVEGGSGADTINGGDGDDTINDSAGDDTISGGAGNDTIDAATGDNTMVMATDGSSTAVTASGFAGGTVAAGDTLTFGNGVEIINNFEAGAGGDVLDLEDAIANNFTTAIAEDQNALTDDTVYFLSGAFNTGTGVFTIAADGAGADTLIIAAEAGADADSTDLTENDNMVVLVGVDTDDLANDNFDIA